MPSFQDLCARRCVADLIHVVEQVPRRVAVRAPLGLDDSSIAMVVLWTLLRWERTFWVVCLENLGVDIWNLTCELDALIRRKKAASAVDGPQPHVGDPWSSRFRQEVDRFLNPLLDRAEQEARAMGHRYLGSEHLLLAIVAGADPPLAALLARCRIHYPEVKDAILAALPQSPSTAANPEPTPAPELKRPWGAGWDTTAPGVPRRFGLAVLLLMVTLYSVLFASMQLLGATPVTFTVVAVLVTGVGLGQTLLFGGKYPRAASIWVGACLFPVEILVVDVGKWLTLAEHSVSVDAVAESIARVALSIPGGAFFGYLSGGLTAGVFFLLDRYAKKPGAQRDSDEGPF